ncbi:hypothetical protein SAMN05660874_05663 [Saccharopolyspora flava]|uniref:Uncharacterized protein n=1 Tax=Saccharopolyspora flava TaxID=95161 RepID=A0A1I6V6Z9_9PSEU|nr:hypothetical protein SAMN05660874_05663 [Saccharopolyspora flava]
MGHTAAEIADRRFADWMRGNLDLAAEHMAVSVTGDPVFGWRMRSIGARARDDSGGDRWLRVVSEFPQWARGQFWTGNADANDLPETISRPHVLGTFEWGDGRCQRAELSTLLPGHPCSNTDIPSTDEPMPFSWWSTLKDTLATLAGTSTVVSMPIRTRSPGASARPSVTRRPLTWSGGRPSTVICTGTTCCVLSSGSWAGKGGAVVRRHRRSGTAVLQLARSGYLRRGPVAVPQRARHLDGSRRPALRRRATTAPGREEPAPRGRPSIAHSRPSARRVAARSSGDTQRSDPRQTLSAYQVRWYTRAHRR